VQPPLEVADAEVAQGQQVFMRFCNGCHPGGEAGVGLALNNKPLPGWAIRFQVRRGLGAMPAFSDEVISDEQLRTLVAYLKTLRRHDG
jgi:mono/diheme cytochrome c family protein